MIKIGVIDYGVGNIGSVINMLQYVGATDVQVLTSPKDLEYFDKIVLPGVGSFDRGMKLLVEKGFDKTLIESVAENIELLGICLGMQLLTEGSEEGVLPGLGIIPGKIKKFTPFFTKNNPIPHMGWNQLERFSNEDYLFDGLPKNHRFYFVHSYYFPADAENFVTSTTQYEESFASSIRKGSTSGVQFHPEKSHSFGKIILNNFVHNA